jgi:hypothetical protein
VLSTGVPHHNQFVFPFYCNSKGLLMLAKVKEESWPGFTATGLSVLPFHAGSASHKHKLCELCVQVRMPDVVPSLLPNCCQSPSSGSKHSSSLRENDRPSTVWLKTVILTTWEAEIESIMGPGQPGQKAWDTHLSHWLGVVIHACHPSYWQKHK